jgi:hypothetical protein
MTAVLVLIILVVSRVARALNDIGGGGGGDGDGGDGDGRRAAIVT